MNSSRTNRGAALVTAVIVSFILVMLVVASIGVTTTSFNLSSSHKNSDAAQLLAEAGINDELALIGRKAFEELPQNRSSQPETASGEPYPGRKVLLPGSSGTYWVRTSHPGNSSTPWSGQGPMLISCTAVVEGAVRMASIIARPTSMFGEYALFALDSGPTGSMAAIVFNTGNVDLTVDGVAGTNGTFERNSGTITYARGYNFNTASLPPFMQFISGTLRSRDERLPLPWVSQVLKRTLSPTAGMSDDAAWAWLRANSHNSARMLQWKPGLANDAPLIPSNVMAAPSTATGISVKNYGGGSEDTFAFLNAGPTSEGSNRKTLILPPGDYYIEHIDTVYNSTTELIIDNAGLSVGGNTTGQPVRIWMNWFLDPMEPGLPPASSRLALLTRFTAPNDPSTFRLFFSIDGQEFQIERDNNLHFGIGGPFSLPGVIYAVTGQYTAGGVPTLAHGGAKVRLIGQNSWDGRVHIQGTLVADRIEIEKDASVSFDVATGNALDPGGGAVFHRGYSDR